MSAADVVPYDCLFEGPLADEAKKRGFRDIIFEPNPKQSPGAQSHLCAVPTCNVVAYDLARCRGHQRELDALLESAEPPASDSHTCGAPGCNIRIHGPAPFCIGHTSHRAAHEPPAPDDNLPKKYCTHVSTAFTTQGQEVCVSCRGVLQTGTKELLRYMGKPVLVDPSEPIWTEPPPGNARWTTRTPNTPEPAPKPGAARATWSLVMADMLERDAAGAAKYGIRHQHDNGRDHLVDAYQEALDLALYLRAEIEKRKAGAR